MVTWAPTTSLAMNSRMASAPRISRWLSLTYASGANVATMASESKAFTAEMCSETMGGSLVVTLVMSGVSFLWGRSGSVGRVADDVHTHRCHDGRVKTRSQDSLSRSGRP